MSAVIYVMAAGILIHLCFGGFGFQAAIDILKKKGERRS